MLCLIRKNSFPRNKEFNIKVGISNGFHFDEFFIWISKTSIVKNPTPAKMREIFTLKTNLQLNLVVAWGWQVSFQVHSAQEPSHILGDKCGRIHHGPTHVPWFSFHDWKNLDQHFVFPIGGELLPGWQSDHVLDWGLDTPEIGKNEIMHSTEHPILPPLPFTKTCPFGSHPDSMVILSWTASPFSILPPISASFLSLIYAVLIKNRWKKY